MCAAIVCMTILNTVYAEEASCDDHFEDDSDETFDPLEEERLADLAARDVVWPEPDPHDINSVRYSFHATPMVRNRMLEFS